METLITIMLWSMLVLILGLIVIVMVQVVRWVISDWSYKLKEGDVLVDKVWEEREVRVTEVSKDYSRVRYVIVEEEGTLVESSINEFLDTYKLKS